MIPTHIQPYRLELSLYHYSIVFTINKPRTPINIPIVDRIQVTGRNNQCASFTVFSIPYRLIQALPFRLDWRDLRNIPSFRKSKILFRRKKQHPIENRAKNIMVMVIPLSVPRNPVIYGFQSAVSKNPNWLCSLKGFNRHININYRIGIIPQKPMIILFVMNNRSTTLKFKFWRGYKLLINLVYCGF